MNFLTRPPPPDPLPISPHHTDIHNSLANRLSESPVAINCVGEKENGHWQKHHQSRDFRKCLQPPIKHHQWQQDEKIDPQRSKSLPKRCVIHSAASRLTFWVRGAAHCFCRVRLNPMVSQSLTFTCIADRQEKTFAVTEFLTRSAFWAGLLDCRRGLIRS